MFPKISRRAFLKHGSSLAVAAGMVPATAPRAFAQAADPALDQLAAKLKKSSLGTVLPQGHPEHKKIKYYNGRFDCIRTGAFLRPASPAGAEAILAWARRHKRSFAIRGGGHSFEGKSSHPEIVIDMSRLTRHRLMDDGRLQVEAGVLLGDVYKTLGAANRILPAGTCPTVGIVGHALGGGIGDFLPMFGYTAQSLIDATLVTLGGSILLVSDREIKVLGGNPLSGSGVKAGELMQVLRGGGQGSLGIVTNMTFKTYDLRPFKLASFHLESGDGVSAPIAVRIIEAWQKWRQDLPAPMQSMVSSKVNLSRAGNRYEFEIAGLIAIPGESTVTVADVRRQLNALFAIPGLASKRFRKSLTVPAAIKTFIDTDETTHNPARKKLYGSSSAFPAALPNSAVEHMIRNMRSNIFVSLYTSGGRTKAGPATSLHPSEFLVEWTTYSVRRERDGHRNIAALRTGVVGKAGFNDLASPNYPDDSARDYFANKAQVEAIRQSLDPDRLSTSALPLGKPLPPLDQGCR